MGYTCPSCGRGEISFIVCGISRGYLVENKWACDNCEYLKDPPLYDGTIPGFRRVDPLPDEIFDRIRRKVVERASVKASSRGNIEVGHTVSGYVVIAVGNGKVVWRSPAGRSYIVDKYTSINGYNSFRRVLATRDESVALAALEQP